MNPMKENRKPAVRRRLPPEQVMALGFLITILVGGLLLTLPISSSTGESVGLLGAMFTATSAVCVTGLNVVDIGLGYSYLGQGITLALIQVGGLGFMIFATLAMVALGRRISLRSRVLIRDSMNQSTLSGLVRLTKWITLLVVVIEGTGALVLMTRFVPQYGWGKGVWFGVYHSISAFCNAGFDLLGNFTSLVPLQNDPVIVLTIVLLINLGSLGFVVIIELINKPLQKVKLTLHTKLVLLMTSILVLGGAAAFAVLEWSNPSTLGNQSFGHNLTNALFQSTTCRTAGFCTVDQMALSDSSKLISCLLMFIGASPASTGGGVKTTTFAMVLLMITTVISSREDYAVFKKRIAKDVVIQAVTIVFLMLGAVIGCTLLLCILEQGNGFSMLDLLFEVVSAISTTGLSSVGSGNLTEPSQVILMLLMYTGRVGPLTLGYALAKRANNAVKNRIHYPEEHIMIG